MNHVIQVDNRALAGKFRVSSSTLRQKNRKIGKISLENRNKIGIYEIKEEQNRNIGSLKQFILLIWIYFSTIIESSTTTIALISGMVSPV